MNKMKKKKSVKSKNKGYKKNNVKINKKMSKNKKGADKRSAPKNNNYIEERIDLNDEIVIGIPREKKANASNKVKKKIKKKKVLTEAEIARRKLMLKFFRWTSFIVIIIMAIIFIVLSPIFNLKHVEVKNNETISFEKIIGLAGIDLNNNMFKYRSSEIKKNIKRNAYIENVKITRKLPDTIEITVEERKPSLMILYGNSYVYLNNQGYILEISDKLLNLPIIENYQTSQEEIAEGKRLCTEDLERLNTVLKILEISESEEIRDKITVVDISDEKDYKVIMYAEQKTIHLGDCSLLEERMIWLKSILEKKKGIAGDIFINMNINEKRPYFRESV